MSPAGMHEPAGTHAPTANERYRATYDRWLHRGLVAAFVVHVTALCFVVTPPAEPMAGVVREPPVVIEIHHPRIPPPPADLALPAEPKVGEESTPEEATIVEMTLDAPPPAETPPIEAARPVVSDFVPYTVAPRCTAGCRSADVLEHLPPLIRKAGVACRVVVDLHVDLGGRVTETRVRQSSGVPACDEAVERWARTTRWTTAYNRDVPVAVWISQPVELSTE